MNESSRTKYLRLALRAVAVIFVFCIYPLTIVWPSGWAWQGGLPEYLQMIIAIYAALGIFLWIASYNPEQHQSLIAFTIWSSIAHGGTMAVQSIVNPQHCGHLLGDVPALFIVAALLAVLSPQALMLRFSKPVLQA